ncbi:hypothetical protein BC936DRAFT_147662 [Jimgerdemannia flammicorona]|uniref:Uncharacterized protein n=1 Tax=Jimgerdemannia flammicorona TaxID=994334 RepID=A0A433D4Y7_9FUNG|nr:hypothetical protein BC936DRAFT_147662 [Jimgerdemannia flammicorona]
MAADSFSYDTFLNDLDNFSFNSDKNTTPDVLDLYTNPQATEPEERGEEGEDEQASVQDDRLSQFKRQIVHQHKSFSQAQLPTPAQSGEFYATSPDDVLMSPLTMPVSGGFEGLDEEDMILLTPLLSPAMTPSYPFSHLSIPGSAQLENFSPLTSPALHPTADTPTSTRTVFTKRSARNVDPRIKSPLAGSVSKRARNSANPVTVLSSATVPPHSEQDCQQAALPTNKADAIAEGTSAHATVPPTPTLHQLNSVDRTSDLPSLRTSSSPLVRPVQPDPATVAMPPPPSPATALAPVTPASLMKLSPSSVAVTPVPHSSAAAAATLPLLVSPALGPITPGNPILLPLLSSPMLGPSSMLAPAILGSPEGIRPTADRRLGGRREI